MYPGATNSEARIPVSKGTAYPSTSEYKTICLPGIIFVIFSMQGPDAPLPQSQTIILSLRTLVLLFRGSIT